jgi:signal transduction histidine kinase
MMVGQMDTTDSGGPKDRPVTDTAKGTTPYTQIVSHQLKSPINAIQSLLKTISEGYAGEVSPQVLQTVKKALTRAGEATDTISDILTFEKYTRGGAIEKSEVDALPIASALATR